MISKSPFIHENVFPCAAGAEILVGPGKCTQPDTVAHYRQIRFTDHTFPVDINRRFVIVYYNNIVIRAFDGAFPVTLSAIGKVIAVPDTGEIDHSVHTDGSKQMVGIPVPYVEHQSASGFKVVRSLGG